MPYMECLGMSIHGYYGHLVSLDWKVSVVEVAM